MRDRLKYGFLTLAALGLAAAPALAESDRDSLSGMQEGDWITITGTVVSVGEDDEFWVAFADGEVEVEMDDFEPYGAQPIQEGDQVTITGQLEDSFFDERAVEASSVYLQRIDDYAYIDPEESDAYFEDTGSDRDDVAGIAPDDEWVEVTGTVTAADDDILTLDTGGATISVDTSDVEQEVPIAVGDRIAVSGEMDDADLFEEGEILASSVTVLREQRG